MRESKRGENVKGKVIDIVATIVCIVSIIWGIYLCFFYKVADKTEVVEAYANVEDYPVYDARNVYEYWKTTLNEKQQILYEEMKESYLQFRDTFSTQIDNISPNEFNNVYRTIYLDHPEIFWMDSYLTIKTLTNNVNTNREIDLYYSHSLEEAKEIKSRIEVRYNEIVEEAKNQDNDFKKIKYVHDKLIEISQYHDYTEEEISQYQSMVSIFETGNTVCAGYAYGFKFIMDQLGIKTICTHDISNEDTSKNHIWNMVELYGKWYNLDITWDNKKDTEGIIYDYFLKDNDEFYTNHRMQYGIPTN